MFRPTIKQTLGDFSWIRKSGKKLVDTFVAGIRSVINKPYEVFKSGLNKLRQLLPFSDAKEGPLSTLTLSGKRVFTTINEGMDKTKELPSLTASKAFKAVREEVSVDASFRPGLRYQPRSKKESISKHSERAKSGKTKEGQSVVIQNLTLHLPDVKELQQVLKLLAELRDYAEGEGVVMP